jgi:hypothetical protein
MDKEAQELTQSPAYVAEQIRDIIGVMVGRMSPEAQRRAYPNILGKLYGINVTEMSNKKSPGGASIGVSISLVKNILNGRDPYFIRLVLEELRKRM